MVTTRPSRSTSRCATAHTNHSNWVAQISTSQFSLSSSAWRSKPPRATRASFRRPNLAAWRARQYKWIQSILIPNQACCRARTPIGTPTLTRLSRTMTTSIMRQPPLIRTPLTASNSTRISSSCIRLWRDSKKNSQDRLSTTSSLRMTTVAALSFFRTPTRGLSLSIMNPVTNAYERSTISTSKRSSMRALDSKSTWRGKFLCRFIKTSITTMPCKTFHRTSASRSLSCFKTSTARVVLNTRLARRTPSRLCSSTTMTLSWRESSACNLSWPAWNWNGAPSSKPSPPSAVLVWAGSAMVVMSKKLVTATSPINKRPKAGSIRSNIVMIEVQRKIWDSMMNHTPPSLNSKCSASRSKKQQISKTTYLSHKIQTRPMMQSKTWRRTNTEWTTRCLKTNLSVCRRKTLTTYSVSSERSPFSVKSRSANIWYCTWYGRCLFSRKSLASSSIHWSIS